MKEGELEIVQRLDRLILAVGNIQITGGGAGVWGSITGTLSDQLDLQAALDAKATDSGIVHIAGTETITGAKTFQDGAGFTSLEVGARTAWAPDHSDGDTPTPLIVWGNSNADNQPTVQFPGPVYDYSVPASKSVDPNNRRLYASDGTTVILDWSTDLATARTSLGLGTLATQNGTFSGTSSGTNTGDQTTVSGNAGTATALQTARNIDGQSFNGTADITVIAPGTHAATSKATPVDADELPLVDSAASNVLKKLTWANLKATAKTYFDTLYQAAGSFLSAATPAQTTAQTSSTVGLTPVDVAYAIFGMAWRYPSCYSTVDFSSANSSGTGGNTINSNGFSITSGATSSSWALKTTAGSLSGMSPSTSALANGLNFDKQVGFKITFRHDAGTTNGVTRFTLVNSTNVATNGSGNTAKLAGKGIGIEIRNAALWAAVHDGTTYSSTSLSTTLTVNAYTTVGVFRSGSGTFDFYVNGAYVLTQSGGPTGTAASHSITAYWAADNSSDSAAQTCLLTECTVFQAIG